MIGAVFSALRPDAFLNPFNLESMAKAAAPLLVMGVGMTFVIITAGIDLAVGSVLVLSGVVAAQVMIAIPSGLGMAPWAGYLIGVAAGIVVGIVVGAVAGTLVARAKITPMIVTLGTMGASLGVAQLLTRGVDVSGVPPEFARGLGQEKLWGIIPWIVVIAVVVCVLGWLALTFTRFGTYTFVIGSNAEAARRAGINVNRHLMMVYALSGACAGLAGVMSLARFSSTTLAAHSLDNFAVITAVILGGTSLFGGIGSIQGTVVGVFIPVSLASGLVIIGVQPFWQNIAVSVVLVVAVLIDQIRRSRRA
ncbi:ABC transporter permease [Compostimonas suwonensis]|uniref:ABC transporter permease n=1 Tax=Compostimonas suwonensis TaxID=1048394 RepID=UPI001B80979C|nr:ABC transporter permease [Compostimonas suwonensis]